MLLLLKIATGGFCHYMIDLCCFSVLFDDTNQLAREIFLKEVGIHAETMNDKDILEKLQEMPVDKILAGLKQLGVCELHKFMFYVRNVKFFNATLRDSEIVLE